MRDRTYSSYLLCLILDNERLNIDNFFIVFMLFRLIVLIYIQPKILIYQHHRHSVEFAVAEQSIFQCCHIQLLISFKGNKLFLNIQSRYSLFRGKSRTKHRAAPRHSPHRNLRVAPTYHMASSHFGVSVPRSAFRV